MAARAPTLKRSVLQALVVLVGLTTMASGSLVVITNVLHDTTQTLTASVGTVRLAKDAQRDLLLHGRSRDPIARTERANDLQSHLFDARSYVSNVGEERVLDRADERVAAYLAAATEAEREAAETPAYEALGELVRVNLAQSDLARRQAARLDTIAHGVGIATALAVLAGAVGFAWWVRARAIRPVIGLARAMRRFGVGNEGERAPEDGPQELYDMAHQFNGMPDRLAEQRQAHRTYLAAVAHDLRNPLGTLRLAADSVRGGAELDPARTERLFSIVRRQIERLTRLADDLLDTANLEAGRLELHVGAHDLRELTRATTELFAASSPKHELDLDLPEEPAVITCDEQRIEQVLANLIGNAIKYSPDGGKVRVSVEVKDEVVDLAVADEGVGMTPEEVERSFHPFTRAATLREEVPGHGLGLFITQRIVEEHGGALSVESAPGRGSTFHVVLPRDAIEHGGAQRSSATGNMRATAAL